MFGGDTRVLLQVTIASCKRNCNGAATRPFQREGSSQGAAILATLDAAELHLGRRGNLGDRLSPHGAGRDSALAVEDGTGALMRLTNSPGSPARGISTFETNRELVS